MTRLLVACALIGFGGCAGTVGDNSPDEPGPDAGWLSPDSELPPPPGNDGTTPSPDTNEPESDGGQPACIKNDDGSCCLQGQPCAVPEVKCSAGQVTNFRCTDDCTTKVDCIDVDPIEPECVLKNGLCCLGDTCNNTTVNVTCAPGFEPGELYCTDNCMPMRKCVESPSDCVAKGASCCLDSICTSVDGVCEQGFVPEFVGCSPSCVPLFDCVQ